MVRGGDVLTILANGLVAEAGCALGVNHHAVMQSSNPSNPKIGRAFGEKLCNPALHAGRKLTNVSFYSK